MQEVPSRSSGNTRAPHCNWPPSVSPVEVHVSSCASHSQSGLEFLEVTLSKHPDQSTKFNIILKQTKTKNFLWIPIFYNLSVNSVHSPLIILLCRFLIYDEIKHINIHLFNIHVNTEKVQNQHAFIFNSLIPMYHQSGGSIFVGTNSRSQQIMNWELRSLQVFIYWYANQQNYIPTNL